MIFQDNVIKEYLKNVYFITGTPCGGKTTISRELGRRHNLPVYDVDEAKLITDYEKIVFLIKQPDNLIEDYCNRPDHTDFTDFINSAGNPEMAKNNCNDTLAYLNQNRYEQIKRSNYFWLERNSSSTVEKTVRKVEQHFGSIFVEI